MLKAINLNKVVGATPVEDYLQHGLPSQHFLPISPHFFPSSQHFCPLSLPQHFDVPHLQSGPQPQPFEQHLQPLSHAPPSQHLQPSTQPHLAKIVSNASQAFFRIIRFRSITEIISETVWYQEYGNVSVVRRLGETSKSTPVKSKRNVNFIQDRLYINLGTEYQSLERSSLIGV